LEDDVMETEIIKAVRLTQILVNNGWLFIDNGYNEIKKVRNDFLDEEISFNTHEEFIDWLSKQENRY